MKFDLAWVRGQLPDRTIHWREQVDSTMTVATELAREGAASGAVIGAEEQTAGLGRYGRSWHSEPGLGIYLSLILRLDFSVENFPCLTLAVGLSAQEAIRATTGVDCDLRWPNDILIEDGKAGGILTQVEGGAVIVGIGINVNHQKMREDLAATATSIRLASGRAHLREPLVVSLLHEVDGWCERIGSHGVHPVIEAFTRRSTYARGRRVSAEAGIRGVTDGLDEQGFLRVRLDSGEAAKVLAGGVRLL